MLFFGGVKVEFEGEEVMVCEFGWFVVFVNYQSIYDIFVFFVILLKLVVFLVKCSFFWILIFGWVFKVFGYVFVDCGDCSWVKYVYEGVVKVFDKDCVFIVFFEGKCFYGNIFLFKVGGVCMVCGVEVVIVVVGIFGI